ncbi:MAG: hypothetical protein ILP12_07715 [Lachnospiraceae bacterium]|nr:hypothetical protein [Lachnospiraceae bacterium]
MKKLLSMLALVLFLCAVLAACGPSEEILAEIDSLKAQVSDLEKQGNEQKSTISTLETSLKEARDALNENTQRQEEFDVWLQDRLTRLGTRYGIPADVIAGLLDGTYIPPELRPEEPYDRDLSAVMAAYTRLDRMDDLYAHADLANRIVLRADRTCSVGGKEYTWKPFTSDGVFIKVLSGEQVVGRIRWTEKADGTVSRIAYTPEDSAKAIMMDRENFASSMAGTFVLAADHTGDSSAAAQIVIREDGTAQIGGEEYRLILTEYCPGFYDQAGNRKYFFTGNAEEGSFRGTYIIVPDQAVQLQDGVLTLLEYKSDSYDQYAFGTYIDTARYEAIELTTENFWDYFTALDNSREITVNKDAFGGVESFMFSPDRLAPRTAYAFFSYIAEIRGTGTSRFRKVTYDASADVFTQEDLYDRMDVREGRNTILTDHSRYYTDRAAELRGRTVFADYSFTEKPAAENGKYTVSRTFVPLDWNAVRVSGRVWVPRGSAPAAEHREAPTLLNAPEYEGSSDAFLRSYYTFSYSDGVYRYDPETVITFLPDHGCTMGQENYTWKAVSANQILILKGDSIAAAVLLSGPWNSDGIDADELEYYAAAASPDTQSVRYYGDAFDRALAGTYDLINTSNSGGYPVRFSLAEDGTARLGEEEMKLLIVREYSGFFDKTGKKVYHYSSTVPGRIQIGSGLYLNDAVFAYQSEDLPDVFHTYYATGNLDSVYRILHTVTLSEDHTCLVNGESFRWEAISSNQFVLKNEDGLAALLYFGTYSEDGVTKVRTDSFYYYRLDDPKRSALYCCQNQSAAIAGSYELTGAAEEGVPGRIVIRADGTALADGEEFLVINNGDTRGLFRKDGLRYLGISVTSKEGILEIGGHYYINTDLYRAVELTAENFWTYFAKEDRKEEFRVNRDSFGDVSAFYAGGDRIVPKAAYFLFSYTAELERSGSYQKNTVTYSAGTGGFTVAEGERGIRDYGNTTTVTGSRSIYESDENVLKGRYAFNSEYYISPLTKSGDTYTGTYDRYDTDWTLKRVIGRIWVRIKGYTTLPDWRTDK